MFTRARPRRARARLFESCMHDTFSMNLYTHIVKLYTRSVQLYTHSVHIDFFFVNFLSEHLTAVPLNTTMVDEVPRFMTARVQDSRCVKFSTGLFQEKLIPRGHFWEYRFESVPVLISRYNSIMEGVYKDGWPSQYVHVVRYRRRRARGDAMRGARADNVEINDD